MEALHVMLPDDEVFMCGVVLLYGVIIGAVVRLIIAWRERSAA